MSNQCACNKGPETTLDEKKTQHLLAEALHRLLTVAKRVPAMDPSDLFDTMSNMAGYRGIMQQIDERCWQRYVKIVQEVELMKAMDTEPSGGIC